MAAQDENSVLLTRIAEALERLAPPKTAEIDLTAHQGYIWVSKMLSAVAGIDVYLKLARY